MGPVVTSSSPLDEIQCAPMYPSAAIIQYVHTVALRTFGHKARQIAEIFGQNYAHSHRLPTVGHCRFKPAWSNSVRAVVGGESVMPIADESLDVCTTESELKVTRESLHV